MSNSKIGTKEAVALILIIAIAHSIISTPRQLLSSMQSAVLLNLIYITIIIVFVLFIIVKLYKNFPGLDILDISEYLGGSILRNILGILFISYFVISSSLLLREFSEALKIIYYPNVNIFFILLCFVISILIISQLDFTTTIKANFIILPIILISCIFLFASNLKSFSITRVFPILGLGVFNTFVLGISNISSFAGISLIYFLPPLLKEPEKFKKISIISVVIFFIFLLLNIAVILFMFSYLMTENEILPLYTAAQYIRIGDFFVRFEALYLLIWIEVIACYLCIITKFCMSILKKITKTNNPKIFGYSFAILILATSLLPNTIAQIKDYEENIYPYISVGFSYVFCILLLLFANLKKNRERNVGVLSNDSSQ